MASEKWWYGIALSLACWLFASVVTWEVEFGTTASANLGGLILFAWVLMPIATYLDIRHVRKQGEWQPRAWFWVLTSLLWVVNIFTGFSYLARRYRYVGL